MQIRLMIADDDRYFRIGLKTELNKFEDLNIIGEAANGDELMKLLRSGIPDVLLLDLNMPRMTGTEVLDRIKEESIAVRTIVISGYDGEDIILQSLRAGAKGFFLKNIEIDTAEVYSAICTVMQGRIYFNEVTSGALLEKRFKQEALVPRQKSEVVFSEKDLAIIRFIALEMTSQQIAKKTHYTTRSLENIRQELIHRAGARTSIGLVLYAIKNGHIQVSELRLAEAAIQ